MVGQRSGPRAGGREGLDHLADEASPGVGGGVAGGGDDAGVGHSGSYQVLGDEVLAQAARRLGAVDEPLHALVGLARSVLQGLGGGEGHGQDVGEAAVGGLHRADGFDVADETVPGVGVGEGLATASA